LLSFYSEQNTLFREKKLKLTALNRTPFKGKPMSKETWGEKIIQGLVKQHTMHVEHGGCWQNKISGQ
jgi:hypothetical protein